MKRVVAAAVLCACGSSGGNPDGGAVDAASDVQQQGDAQSGDVVQQNDAGLKRPYPDTNATIALPDGAPFLPPPQTMTTYCLPLIVYVDGVALPAAGSVVSHISLPVSLS